MTQPRKHHYLPRFYLGGFSANSRSLSQIEKSTGRSFVCSLRDVASIKDYHRLDKGSTEDSFELEKHLGSIEGRLARALREVFQHGLTNTTLTVRLVELVSLLRLRVPAVKTQIENTIRQIARSSSLLLHSTRQIKSTSPEWLESLRKDEIPIKVSNSFCLRIMFSLAYDVEILELLYSMRPIIIKTPDNSSFITCDQPVAIYNPSATFSQAAGVAIEDSDTEITLPLSSNTLLKLDWTEGDPIQTIASPEEVDEYNRRSVIMASSYVFSPTPFSTKAGQIVHNYRQYSAGIQPSQSVDFGQSVLFRQFFRPVLQQTQYKSFEHSDA